MFLIIIQGGGVAVGDAGLADEGQGIAFPIAFHEVVEIALVPGGGLVGQDLADSGFVAGLGKGGGGEQEQEAEDE